MSHEHLARAVNGSNGHAASAAVDAVDVARDVADELAADAVVREGAGAVPAAEVARLRRSGLLGLLVPAERGGGGQSWEAAHQVIRTVGAADASVGQLLGYHYLHLWRVGLCPDAARRARLESGTVHHGWFWAGASDPRDEPLRLTPDAGGYRLNGRTSCATGARVAQRLVASAVRTDTGETVTFVLAAEAPGIRHLADGDDLGQRLAARGGVEFADAPVAGADVLDVQPAPAGPDAASPRRSLAPLGFQAVVAQLCVAVAEGALGAAADHVRHRSRATADPYVLATYGELVARTAAAAALTELAVDAFDRAAARGRALTAAERDGAAVAIATAQVAATGVANEVSARIFELTGARSTAACHGLDRFWRNARTLTLHDPVTHTARAVGDHHLTGAPPPLPGAG